MRLEACEETLVMNRIVRDRSGDQLGYFPFYSELLLCWHYHKIWQSR